MFGVHSCPGPTFRAGQTAPVEFGFCKCWWPQRCGSLRPHAFESQGVTPLPPPSPDTGACPPVALTGP